MVKKKPYKIYRIDWLDSCHQGGWVHTDDYKPHPNMLISSIGYLVNEDDMSVTIVSSFTHDSGQVHTPLQIPKCAIVKRKRVRDG